MSTENNVYQNKGLVIVHFIGITLWTLCFFLGFICWSDNYLVAIPVALVLGVLLVVFVYYMCYYRPKVSSRDIFRERMLLILYIVVSVVSTIFINHIVTITATEKSIIQKYVSEQEAIVDRYFGDENTDGSYLFFIKKRFEHKQMTDPKEDRLLFESELKGDATFGVELEEVAYRDFKNYCNHVANWNWFTVSGKLRTLEELKLEIEKKLLELSQKPNLVGNVTFSEFLSPSVETQNAKLRNLAHLNGNYILTTLMVVVVQVMMLGIYIWTIRVKGRIIIPDDRKDLFIRK